VKMDVKKMAKLANVPLTKEEEEKFRKTLPGVLALVEKIKKMETKGIDMTAKVTGLENVTREDTIDPSRYLGQTEKVFKVSKLF